jgi:hypothetical protein
MPSTVSLRDFVNEMDVDSDEYTAYINRKTGELVTLSEEDILLAEGEEDADELAEGEQDLLPRIREVMESAVMWNYQASSTSTIGRSWSVSATQWRTLLSRMHC